MPVWSPPVIKVPEMVSIVNQANLSELFEDKTKAQVTGILPVVQWSPLDEFIS